LFCGVLRYIKTGFNTFKTERVEMTRMLINFLMIIFLLLSCDTEKYFSYNYDAREFSEIASFSGTVTNVFTGARVPGATIRIEDQSTVGN